MYLMYATWAHRSLRGTLNDGGNSHVCRTYVHVCLYVFVIGASMFTASMVTDISLHSGRSSVPLTKGEKVEVKIDFTKANDHPILKVQCIALTVLSWIKVCMTFNLLNSICCISPAM